jgi:hypothetical protein
MTRPRLLAILLAATVTTGVLAGCTPSPEPDPEPTETSSDAAQEPGVTDIQDAPGSGEGLVGALADAETETCEAGDGAWISSGTVTNPTDAPANYRIYVSLLTGDNDTRGVQQVNVDGVEPEATADWESSIEVDDEDLTCVLRVERYAAG